MLYVEELLGDKLFKVLQTNIDVLLRGPTRFLLDKLDGSDIITVDGEWGRGFDKREFEEEGTEVDH